MNKAVIFDGDGTLWRPIGQGKNSRPDIIYRGGRVEKDSYLGIELVNGVSKMLSNLRDRGYKIFIVSAHPVPGNKALKELESKIVTLSIGNLIDDFFCSDGGNRDGKTEVIRSIIEKFNIDPVKTYMIGDSYYYDYEAGMKAGVNSYYIRNNYCKQPSTLSEEVQLVEDVTELTVA